MTPKPIVLEEVWANNLKHFSCSFERGKLVLVTGPSGSGKSSLVFGTVLPEARRKVSAPLRCDLETASAATHCRGSSGLSYPIPVTPGSQPNRVLPSVASVSGMSTDLELLYFSLGVPHCIYCDAELPNTSMMKATQGLAGLDRENEIHVLSPLPNDGADRAKAVEAALSEGFTKAVAGEDRMALENLLSGDARWSGEKLAILIDAFPCASAKLEERARSSIALARRFGEPVVIRIVRNGITSDERLSAETPNCNHCGKSQNALSLASFSPFRRAGRCPECIGAGAVLELNAAELIDPQTPILGNTRLFSRSSGLLMSEEEQSRWAKNLGLRKTTTWANLSEKKREAVLFGARGRRTFPMVLGRRAQHSLADGGVAAQIYETAAKRQELFTSSYFRTLVCPSCNGSRVRKEASRVRLNGRSYEALLHAPAGETANWAAGCEERAKNRIDLESAIDRIVRRGKLFDDFSLGHLTLTRSARSLSSGEYQRTELVRELVSQGSGVTYLVDEPSVGLHPRDLAAVVDRLRELSNSQAAVIVIDHHEDLVAAADQLLVLGPGGGTNGGELIFSGTPREYGSDSATAKSPPEQELPSSTGTVTVRGLSIRNVTNANFEISLGVLTGVCGVSGSGKSSAFIDGLEPALRFLIRECRTRKPTSAEMTKLGVRSISGWESLERVAVLDRISLSRDSRSTVVSILGALPILNAVFASSIDAKIHGITAAHLSKRTPDGRCVTCGGTGRASKRGAELCADCEGTGLSAAALSLSWKGKTLRDVLTSTIDESLEVFQRTPVVGTVFRAVSDLGLGYLKLIQPMRTLSAGEQQRLRLAAALARGSRRRTLYILDEPSRGLGGSEIEKLIRLLRQLLSRGHSFVVIEHRPLCLRLLDVLMEFGPGSGSSGGKIIASGTVSEIRKSSTSVIAHYL